jgi:multidrug efflux pump
MWLSDISVKRPVFASVISLLLVAFGMLSFSLLPLREFPDINPPIVSINTTYIGASAEVIETRITQIIEDQVSGIEGIKSISSRSRDERSSINIEFNLDRNIDEAANDVRDRVARIVGRLPDDVEPPVVAKQDSDARPIMYISLTSTQLDMMQLHDYGERYIVDRFAIIPGVASAALHGGSKPSMRIWLDRLALAARDLTVTDIENALRRENLELPAGRLESREREFRIRLARGYQTAEDFRQLVLGSGAGGHLVRLGEVAEIQRAPQNLRESFRANQQTTVGLAIVKQSTANTLATLESHGIRREFRRFTFHPRGHQLRLCHHRHHHSPGKPGDPDFPGQPARHDHSGNHHTHLPHLGVHRPGVFRLFGKSHYPARLGALYWAGSGRRHRGAGKHSPPSAGRRATAAGRLQWIPSGGICGHGNHRRAGRGVHSHHIFA